MEESTADDGGKRPRITLKMTRSEHYRIKVAAAFNGAAGIQSYLLGLALRDVAATERRMLDAALAASLSYEED